MPPVNVRLNEAVVPDGNVVLPPDVIPEVEIGPSTTDMNLTAGSAATCTEVDRVEVAPVPSVTVTLTMKDPGEGQA
jgi:hypothetical protein